MNKKKFFAEFGVDEETVNPNKPGKRISPPPFILQLYD